MAFIAAYFRLRIARRLPALSAAVLFCVSAWGTEQDHTVPYVPSASAEGHVGVVRVESRSAFPGEVRIVAVDDAGRRTEAGQLALGARASAQFDAAALELGDAGLGLVGTGSGDGGWRLELSTELDIEARAYARSEGFVGALHDAVLVSFEEVELPLFRTGGAGRGVLRLVNAGGGPAVLRIRGVDDAGRTGGAATVELGPWEARSYTASELEGGAAAGLSGSLGGGEGDWRLVLDAERGAVWAVNLLLDGSGRVSSVPGGISRGRFHLVPLFPSATDGEGLRGAVRAVNRTSAPAAVQILPFDATDRAHEALRLTLGAAASAEFDSADLEHGNVEKGLAGSTGPGEGDWWLELSSASEIEVLSHLVAASGAAWPVRGTAGAETASGMRYEALLWEKSGELRLLNAGGERAEVRISGVDDAGTPGGEVGLELAPWSSRTLASSELEEGGAGISGALGAGSGDWRLTLLAGGEIDVLSLARGPDGALSDLSRRGRPAGAPLRVAVVDTTGAAADLWVTASASESELSPGEAFELSATVGNRGGRGASGTTLRYYRSADAVISASDAQVGTDYVGALAPGEDVRESHGLNAPSNPGTYHYGACADQVPEETDPSDNCSAVAVAVTVTLVPRPDLIVVEPAVSDTTPSPGGSFTLSVKVRNQGRAASDSTTLRYYQSADATISRADAQSGADTVAALAARDSSDESITLNAPAEAGTYYFGGCVDSVADESDASNNCSTAATVTVTDSTSVASLYGASTLSLNQCFYREKRKRPAYGWGIALDQESEGAAIDRAIQDCVARGGQTQRCRYHALAFERCAAIAIAFDDDSCGMGHSPGASKQEAEHSALAGTCFGRTCEIVASACNSTP